MDSRFKEKLEQSARVNQYEKEIELLLARAPHLIGLHQEIQDKLSKVGDLKTSEGRANRAAMAFYLMQESFQKFREGLNEYRSSICDVIEGARKPSFTIIDDSKN